MKSMFSEDLTCNNKKIIIIICQCCNKRKDVYVIGEGKGKGNVYSKTHRQEKGL